MGLHAADSERLVGAGQLVRRDNTVVLVEHDPDMLRVADHVIELGPGPGAAGGEVVYSGPPSGFGFGARRGDGAAGAARALRERSPTLAALERLAKPRKLAKARRQDGAELVITGARARRT